MISKVLTIWDHCIELNEIKCKKFNLVANDIDVYHEQYSDELDLPLNVDLHAIKKINVVGLPYELNMVKCFSIRSAGFLENNDNNITGSCFEIEFSRDKVLTLHASPCFWQFVFEKPENRVIKVANTFAYSIYKVTTAIRLAFKKYEMQQFKFDMGKLDPANGTFANSQKVKYDRMKDWVDSPFHSFECKKKNNCFSFISKHNKEKCLDCGLERVNKQCTYKCCKKCCVNFAVSKTDKCKIKDHATAANELREKLAEDEVLVAGEMDVETN
jgi:hypothetical protein